MSKPKYIKKVIYEIESHEKPGQFSVPREVLDALGLTHEDMLILHVQDASTGEVLFTGRKEMRSGPEIYGNDMKAVRSKQRLQVTVSRAD